MFRTRTLTTIHLQYTTAIDTLQGVKLKSPIFETFLRVFKIHSIVVKCEKIICLVLFDLRKTRMFFFLAKEFFSDDNNNR